MLLLRAIPRRRARNIVIFSDGTGQRGGVYFDEARTNIYKLYRAARCGPDSSIPPDRQLAFYDPGLGTRSTGSVLTSLGRTIYNYVSQATGLGITHNIIDCYTAIIQLWHPGDRIFLFGFSRGAYTVRCLATALCLSGIPTQECKDKPLKRDDASARKLATRAVKSVYQHVAHRATRSFWTSARHSRNNSAASMRLPMTRAPIRFSSACSIPSRPYPIWARYWC